MKDSRTLLPEAAVDCDGSISPQNATVATIAAYSTRVAWAWGDHGLNPRK